MVGLLHISYGSHKGYSQCYVLLYMLWYTYIYIYISLSLCEIRLGVYKFGVLLGSWNSSILSGPWLKNVFCWCCMASLALCRTGPSVKARLIAAQVIHFKHICLCFDSCLKGRRSCSMSLRRGILALSLNALATMLAGCGCDRYSVGNMFLP